MISPRPRPDSPESSSGTSLLPAADAASLSASWRRVRRRASLPVLILTAALFVSVPGAGCSAGGPPLPQPDMATAVTEVADAAGSSRYDGPAIDAVLPAAEGWRLFQLGARRQAVVAARAGAWEHGVPRAPVWRAVAAPSGAFRPVQAVPGQRGYFYLVDAASARLCLYDAEASLLSTYPLPPDFTPFPAGRAAVFRGADGAFTFVDYGTGEARQYADRQTFDAGATRWIPRGRVKLPSGVRACVQPPGSTDLFCRDAGGAPLRFDGALNRVAPRASGGPAGAAPGTTGEDGFGGLIAPRWDGERWIFEGRPPAAHSGRPGAAPGVLFRYRGAEKTWERFDPGVAPPDHDEATPGPDVAPPP